jgi:hypothetical protein
MGPTHVYIMKSGIAVKVGVTQSPPRRVNEARTFNPGVELICAIEHSTPKKIEKLFHHKFKDRSCGGEWFKMSATVAKKELDLIIANYYPQRKDLRSRPKKEVQKQMRILRAKSIVSRDMQWIRTIVATEVAACLTKLAGAHNPRQQEDIFS